MHGLPIKIMKIRYKCICLLFNEHIFFIEFYFKAQDRYLMKDPDPFEERHPSRIDSECPFGLILKTFFKKEPLVAEIFTNYLRENYFTRLGQVRMLVICTSLA